MKKVALTVTMFCVFLLGIATGIAQDKPADTNQLVMEKIKADRKLFVAENMQLTEAEAKAFWPVYDSYQKEMSSLNDRAGKLIDDYAKNYNSMTDETAKKLLDEMIVIENDRLKVRKDALPKFRKVLSDRKVARYYQLENKIYAVVNYQLARAIPLVK
jgi:polyhydroxyalkanoate synthesis regulator phasin